MGVKEIGRVIVFGASGNVGKAVLQELKARNIKSTSIIRNQSLVSALSPFCDDFLIGDPLSKEFYNNLFRSNDVIISCLGASISLRNNINTFEEVDVKGNYLIIENAQNVGVMKIIYLSAFGANVETDLNYLKSHQKVEDKLKISGINYSIIRPVGLFCAFNELIQMARKGQLVHFGTGESKTNILSEFDLSRIIIDSINWENSEVNCGGKEILSRKKINEIIYESIGFSDKSSIGIPPLFIKMFLPLIKIINKTLYDKICFFLNVSTKDCIAPEIGSERFREYLEVSKLIN